MSNKIDLVGVKFGKLEHEVLSETDKRQGGSIVYICRCGNCGKEMELSARRIIHDAPISCGCLNNRSVSTTKHGMTKNREKSKFYRIYQKIKTRCYGNDINAIKYREREIVMCENWKNSFENFKEDMYSDYLVACKKYGEKNVSIDRKNPKGDYCKENCRWANPVIQSYNQDHLNNPMNKTILAIRIEDNYKIVTPNAKMFSRRIFGTPNNHIRDVCLKKRKHEKGWTFEYIDKNKYLELKEKGIDFIESLENFKICIEYHNVVIDKIGHNHKTKDCYLNSIRNYYINNLNKIEYGIYKEIYDSLGFKTAESLKNNLYGKRNRVRKLTEKEIQMYLTKEQHDITFTNIRGD